MDNMQSAGTWTCACGFQNKEEHRFCISCGKSHPMPATAPQLALTPQQSAANVDHFSDNSTVVQAGVNETANRAPTLLKQGSTTTAAPNLEEPKATMPQSEAFGEPKASGFQQNKRTIFVIVVALLLLIGAFFGYGAYRDKRFASECAELIVVMTETQNMASSIAALSPEANANQQELANRFAKQAEQVQDLESALSGKSGSAASKEQYERMMVMVAKDKEMLQKASNLLKSANTAKSKDDLELLGNLHKEFEVARKEVQEGLDTIRIPGQKASQTISYQELGDNMRAYMMKKLGQNQQYLSEKMQQYQTRLQADNEALKKKSEVVFLTESVKKDGMDLLIQGKFYNGTPEQVVGVGEMLIDVTLNQFDSALTTITDFRYEDPGLARTEIAPGGAAGAIHLRLVGQAPKEAFNNFTIRVHKIHWKIRRLVKG